MGFISAHPDLIKAATALLEKKFGPVDFESDTLIFNYTGYYTPEFGDGLLRKFIGFKKLVSEEGLGRVKLYTGKIESRFKANDKRKINIDPGYLALGKLVLFSTKDFSHRLYLSKGVYAEVTLHFKQGSFRHWPYTFPDYRTSAYIDIFNRIREIYKKQVGHN